MAIPLKDYYNNRLIGNITRAFHSLLPIFNSTKFEKAVFAKGWNALGLKERVSRVTEALHTHKPKDFPAAAQVITEVIPIFQAQGEMTYSVEYLVSLEIY